MIYSPSIKRLLDVILSLIAIIMLSPLFFCTACMIKFFDPGPVIFRQNRIGKFGIPFDFYKFRSMPVNTGDMPSDQIGGISLTWIGRLIRRTNIDELPQLINILKGDMSIIGPRPSIPSQLELFELRKANGALNIAPGLTGLAQILSYDGMTIAQKAEFDGQYVKEIRFFKDMGIILRTFVYLLKPPPKY